MTYIPPASWNSGGESFTDNFKSFDTSTPGQKMNFGGGGKSPLEQALMDQQQREELARKQKEQEIEAQRLQNEQQLGALAQAFQSQHMG